MASLVLYFANNTDTMIATKALRDGGIESRMLPVPPNTPTTSNLCLSISDGSENAALSTLQTAKVVLGGILR